MLPIIQYGQPVFIVSGICTIVYCYHEILCYFSLYIKEHTFYSNIKFDMALFLLLVSTFLFCHSTTDAQEFKFTASCGNSPLVTTNSNCDSLNNKIDKLFSYVSTQNDTNTTSVGQQFVLASKLESLLQVPPPSYIPGSCQDIKDHWPYSGSGYYTISTSNGDTKVVYCHMKELCNNKGPWTRIAYLNMSDPTHRCPNGFRLYTSNGIRSCGRPSTNSGGCQSQLYISPPSNGYKEVCGKVIGYQYYDTDAFRSHAGRTIDTYYVDGISLTYGTFPRRHIWTFAAGQYDNLPDPDNCPCSSGSPQSVPSFVGNDYFCENGCSESSHTQKLYTTDPLWDGKGCGSLEGDCCSVSGLPWFHKVL